MSANKQPHGATPAPKYALASILATVAALGALVLIVTVAGNLGNADANAAPVAATVPDQVVSPEEHSAFIRESHGRAAREGDGTPVPSTF